MAPILKRKSLSDNENHTSKKVRFYSDFKSFLINSHESPWV